MKMSVFYRHLTEAALQRGVPLEQVLREARALGYEGLECDYPSVARDPKGFSAMLAVAGLEISSIYCPLDFHMGVFPEQITEMLRNVALSGCRRILAIPGEVTDSFPNALERMVEGLSLLCREAEGFGITVTLEDFDADTSPCATAEGLRYFFDRISGLRFTLDTGNFLYMEQDVQDALALLLDKLDHVHLKDRSLASLHPGDVPRVSIAGRPLYPCPVGTGVIPMEPLLQILQAAGFDGYCSAEHFGAADQWDYITRSAQWMASKLPMR